MFKALYTLFGALVVALAFASTAATADVTYLPVEAMVYYVQTSSATPKTCNGAVAYDSSGSGSTQLVTLSSGAPIYICGYTIFGGNSGAQAQLVYGTGSNCATGRVALTPPYQLTAQTPIVDGGDYVAGLQTAASNALCIVTNYTYYRTITINHTKVGTVNNTDQSNFPVLISGTYTQLKTVANGGHVQNANGYDIIFTSDAAGTNTLNYEVESYTASTGAVTFWVKVPTVSHSADTVIYMWYGNPGITTSQANATSVWDTNYKGVWHMMDHAASKTVTDATANNNGTNAANTSTKTATGQIGKALTYNGTSDDALIADQDYFSPSNNDMTISFWAMVPVGATAVNAACGDNTAVKFLNKSSASNYEWWFTNSNNTSVCFHGSTFDGATGLFDLSKSFTVNDGAWHYYTALVQASSTSAAFYVDGALAANTTSYGGNAFASLDSTASQVKIALNDNNARFAKVNIDEVELSNIARSTDWINTSYNNQNSPSTFYTVGSEQQP